MITAEEYEHETKALIMGDTKYPEFGYRPIDIRNRILELLNTERLFHSLQTTIKREVYENIRD